MRESRGRYQVDGVSANMNLKFSHTLLRALGVSPKRGGPWTTKSGTKFLFSWSSLKTPPIPKRTMNCETADLGFANIHLSTEQADVSVVQGDGEKCCNSLKPTSLLQVLMFKRNCNDVMIEIRRKSDWARSEEKAKYSCFGEI